MDSLLEMAKEPPAVFGVIPILVHLAEFLTTPERVARVQGLLSRQIGTLQPAPVTAALEALATLETRPAFAAMVDPITEQIMSRVEALPHFAPDQQAPELARYLAQRFARLSDDQRMRFLRKLNTWLGQAPTQASTLRPIFDLAREQLSESERTMCVDAFLRAEQTPGLMPNVREDLFVLALGLAGDGRRAPGRAVRNHLAALEKSSDPQALSIAANAKSRHAGA